MIARRCMVRINFRGVDISEYVESFTYSDNTDFTDDVSVVLSDRDRFWSDKFFPETGDILTAEIQVVNWNNEGDNRSIKLGSFEVDSISYSVTKLTVSAVAVPVFSSIRDEKNYKTWENVKLSVIAGDIAKKADLSLIFESDTDPEYDKSEQNNESDLSYLEKLCTAEGLAIKISGRKLVVFNEEKYDTFEPAVFLEAGKSYFYGYPSFKRSAKNIYSGCEIKYFDSKTDNVYTGIFNAPDMENLNKILKLQEKFNSETDTIYYNRKAKARLREQNKKEWTASVKLKGDIIYFAGTNVNLKGFYKFDGKYNITTCKHSISRSGYVVTLDLRKCLEGY